MKPGNFIVLVVGVTIICLNLYFMDRLEVPVPKDGHAVIEYKDFAAILLTAVAVIVAVLAIVVGLLAIWGYKEFVERADSKALATAKTVAEQQIDIYFKSPEFAKQLKDATAGRLQEEATADVVPEPSAAAEPNAAVNPLSGIEPVPAQPTGT